MANPAYPRIREDFARSFDVVRKLPCDLLLTPHPDQSGWDYANAPHPRSKTVTCAVYADAAEARLTQQANDQKATAQ